MAIEIKTTQNVTFHLNEAGLGPRILARMLDGFFLMLWVIGMFIIFIAGTPLYRLNNDSWMIIIFLMLFPVLFYDLLFEYFNKGQSPGKAILKIRVVKLDGTTPSFGSYCIRWVFRLVDFTLTGGALALLLVAFSDKSQRLGDILAGTTVISLKPEVNTYELSIPEIYNNDSYKVTYSDVLDKLNDSDIRTVRTLLKDSRYFNDGHTLDVLAGKIQEVTGYAIEESSRNFLTRVVDDYDYLSIQ